ncbi:hypothetical protein [Streptomyces lunaelactis]|uniref:hypothetical protein n=1 Tax=Streptomyces lunaelactis TaxID=1535768 RepID=UPI001584E0FB|nr:hypothetical protein [Streptomyces lunaelactis]NUL09069.1 hypothetical protein [Streptomyces lunaelactis]
MATSAVPAAIDALLAILRAAPALDGVDVIDGPPLDDGSTHDWVAIGWQPTGDEGAQLGQTFAYAGGRRRDEESLIHGWAESWTGDGDIRVPRLRAFELLGVIESAIRNSDAQPAAANLGGVVLWSEFSAGLLRQVSDDMGLKAGIGFSIACRARI